MKADLRKGWEKNKEKEKNHCVLRIAYKENTDLFSLH